MVALKPGNMDITLNVDDLTDSIAETIDFEYDRLLKAANLPRLTFDMTDKTVRDRRRLFTAIARGIVIHLAKQPVAFTVTVPNVALPVTVDTAIATDGV